MPSVNGYSAEMILSLIGDVIQSTKVVGTHLIITTVSGKEIDAGDVKGIADPSPTATKTVVTPVGTIAATNVQTALAEIDTDFGALRTSKLNKTDLPTIAMGSVNHQCDMSQDGLSGVMTTVDYPTLWAVGFFAAVPRVFLTINDSQASKITPGSVYSILNNTARGFSIRAQEEMVTTGGTTFEPATITFNYLAIILN